MTDLTELATRIEQAEGPSSDLDMEIWCAVVASPKHLELIEIGRAAHGEDEARFRTDRFMDGRRYTFSLNAAMTLVPEGWGYTLVAVPGQGTDATVREWRPDKDGKFWSGNDMARAQVKRAATPALALCAAALRARGAA